MKLTEIDIKSCIKGQLEDFIKDSDYDALRNDCLALELNSRLQLRTAVFLTDSFKEQWKDEASNLSERHLGCQSHSEEREKGIELQDMSEGAMSRLDALKQKLDKITNKKNKIKEQLEQNDNSQMDNDLKFTQSGQQLRLLQGENKVLLSQTKSSLKDELEELEEQEKALINKIEKHQDYYEKNLAQASKYLTKLEIDASKLKDLSHDDLNAFVDELEKLKRSLKQKLNELSKIMIDEGYSIYLNLIDEKLNEIKTLSLQETKTLRVIVNNMKRYLKNMDELDRLNPHREELNENYEKAKASIKEIKTRIDALEAEINEPMQQTDKMSWKTGGLLGGFLGGALFFVALFCISLLVPGLPLMVTLPVIAAGAVVAGLFSAGYVASILSIEQHSKSDPNWSLAAKDELASKQDKEVIKEKTETLKALKNQLPEEQKEKEELKRQLTICDKGRDAVSNEADIILERSKKLEVTKATPTQSHTFFGGSDYSSDEGEGYESSEEDEDSEADEADETMGMI